MKGPSVVVKKGVAASPVGMPGVSDSWVGVKGIYETDTAETAVRVTKAMPKKGKKGGESKATKRR
jgi:hypothetical protein